MRVLLRWFLTNKVTPLEDDDAILNANTTIAEVKGLIQVQFGFSAKEVLLLLKDRLLENWVVLRDIGVCGTGNDPVLLAHVVHLSELESVHGGDVDDTTHDDDLQSFSHADFILAMKMLGKKVAVPDDRLVAMREHAPRQRPAFLDRARAQPQRQQQRSQPTATVAAATADAAVTAVIGTHAATDTTTSTATATATTTTTTTSAATTTTTAAVSYDPEQSIVYAILDNVQHGLRKDGVDQQLAIAYPGLKPFAFWDMRLPNETALTQQTSCSSSAMSQCLPGELCVELFYFGEYAAVHDWALFTSLVQRSLETTVGVRPCKLLPPREAGCMYPLVACPVVLHEVDVMELGRRVFDDFGKPQTTRAPSMSAHSSRAANVFDAVGQGRGANTRDGTCAPQ